MLTPAEHGPLVYRGATWEMLLSLWANQEHTKPFSLAGAATTLTILTSPEIALKEGHGLTVVEGKEAKGSEAAEPTTVFAELTPEETEAVTVPNAQFVLAYTQSGKVSWLMRGTMTFESP